MASRAGGLESLGVIHGRGFGAGKIGLSVAWLSFLVLLFFLNWFTYAL